MDIGGLSLICIQSNKIMVVSAKNSAVLTINTRVWLINNNF